MVQYQFPFPIRFYDHADGYKSTLDRDSKHRGVDFNGAFAERWLNTSDKASAIADGTVVFNGWHNALGNMVVLRHPDGIFSGYCHLSAVENLGPTVARGAPIGNIGNTGSASGGVHLHLTTAFTAGGAAGDDPYDTNHFDPIQFINARLNEPEVPTTPEEEMPLSFESIRSIATPLAKKTWAEIEAPSTPAQFTNLVYNDSATATNIGELTGWKGLLDINLTLYIRNLPAGEFVNVRLAYQNRATGVYSGFASATITGSASGRVRGQYSSHANLNQDTHRLVAQACASTTGVIVDVWRVDGFAW